MAKGVNKVILIGALGNDPEVKITQGGAVIASLSVATNDSVKDKTSGEWQERTEWHKVVLFNRVAEVAKEYLKKGSQVYIEGRLQTRKWQDKEGHDRYTTEIVGNDMQMLGGRQSANAQPYQSSDYPPPSSQPAAPTYAAPKPAVNPTHPSANFDPGFSDDDIPF